MDFTDWQLLKLILFTVGAFFYGLWRGFTGRSMRPGPRDIQAAASPDSPGAAESGSVPPAGRAPRP
jgi:hypothetical protein